MLASTARRSMSIAARAQEYSKLILPLSGVHEVPVLSSLLPAAGEGLKQAFEFHDALEQVLIESGQRRVATMVAAPTLEQLRVMRIHEVVTAPLFSFMCDHGTKGAVTIRRARADSTLQYAEMGLLVTGVPPSGADGAVGPKDVLPLCQAVTPAIIFSGTRWPFCAPHGVGLVADLLGVTKVVLGEPLVPPRELDFAQHGAVLTRGATPVQVGFGRLVAGHPATAIRKVLTAKPSEQSVLCCGWSQRVLLEKGSYKANFGALGSVDATVE